MPDKAPYVVRWNVTRRGHVIGQVIATEYLEAQRAAQDVYGHGVRVSAPTDHISLNRAQALERLSR
jgi:hypothetical protein